MHFAIFLIIHCIYYTSASKVNKITNSTNEMEKLNSPLGCFCGVFMDGQLKKGSKEQPKGKPILSQKQSISCPCSPIGNRICFSSCLATAMKYISNDGLIVCGTLGRDCKTEKAHLFIKNCKDEWIDTNLSRAYCCKDGVPYKCPVLF